MTTELRHAAEKYHGIDALILNAGILDPVGKVADSSIPLDEWKRHFDVNFFSLITAVRGALPALRKSRHGGRIVFVSSGAAAKGTAAWGPYNASKAAMNSLCRCVCRQPKFSPSNFRPEPLRKRSPTSPLSPYARAWSTPTSVSRLPLSTLF